MKYRLKFIDSVENIVRELSIEADDDAIATTYACNQCVHFQSTVELCEGARRVLRVTPMTARLYFLENSGASH